MTLCPFALITGTACPGCGMTRAFGRLVGGDLVGAFSFHPLFPLVAIVGLVGAVWYLGYRQRGWKPIPGRVLSATLALTTIAFLGVWLWRLATDNLPPV